MSTTEYTPRTERNVSDAKRTVPALASLDLVCFSHLRWSFVYQRPQHLLSRFAKIQRVFFIEEPIYRGEEDAHIEEYQSEEGVHVITPVLPNAERVNNELYLKSFVKRFISRRVSPDYIAWYYTPMALSFTKGLEPAFCVYDCMDELSNFLGAPQEMKERERELFLRADVVFTGGYSLFEAKSAFHTNVYPFRSSIDRAHFAQALSSVEDPADQAGIPYPRAGYYGVIDERFDIELLKVLAETRADWQFIMIGPVAKISSSSLPRLPNVHYLGQKKYTELPSYVGHWQVALLPFAQNTSTRFISPTKVPEYLAALRPVISTPIRDVYRDYGREGLVFIADTPHRFAALLDRANSQRISEIWRRRIERKLAGLSWDSTWKSMVEIMENIYARRAGEIANT